MGRVNALGNLGLMKLVVAVSYLVTYAMCKDIPSTSSLPIPGEDPVSGSSTRVMSRVQKDPNFDPCSPNLCTNGGQCASTPDKKFYCVCPDGFVGRLCQRQDFSVADPCSPNPCYNGGECTKQGTLYSCFCPSGFGGKLCDKSVSDDAVEDKKTEKTSIDNGPCASRPCKFDGKCTEVQTPGTGAPDFTCACQEAYFGKSCQFSTTDENAMNPCFPNPCGSGLCDVVKSDPSGFRCACPDNLYGAHCEYTKETHDEKAAKHKTIHENMRRHMYASSDLDPHSEDFHPCSADPCLNGGTCSMDEEDLHIICKCPRGFAGHFCDRDIEQFNGCVRNPCYNGGKCVTEVHELIGYRCECPEGFEGQLCEQVVGDYAHHRIYELLPHEIPRSAPNTPFHRRMRASAEKRAQRKM